MIPVTILNDQGKVIGQQAFNDNLTLIETLNRTLLAVIYKTQLELTNKKTALDEALSDSTKIEGYDAKLQALTEASFALDKAITAAIETFDGVVKEQLEG